MTPISFPSFSLLAQFKTSAARLILRCSYGYAGARKKAQRVRTPTILQMEAVECGAAALAIVLAHYGRIVPLATLRQDCGVSRDGSTASNVVMAARRYGLKAKGFKKGINALKELRCPYIVFWNFNHFLVVEGWQKEQVYVNDPATGPRSVALQEFQESYTGVVLVLEPGPEFQPGGQKPSLLLALGQRLRGSIGAIAYCLLLGLLLVIPGLAIPAFTQIFVDDVLVQGRQDWLRPLIWGMVTIGLLRGALSGLQLHYLRRLKIKLAVTLSSQFLWHTLRLPLSFYGQRYAGEISHRVNLNDKVADVLSGRLATTAIDVVMMSFYALIMFSYDWLLTLIGIGLAALNLVTLGWVARQRIDSNRQLVQEYGKLAGITISGLQAIETLKASALEAEFFTRWTGYYTKVLIAQQELGVPNQLLSVLPTLLSTLAFALLLLVGGLRVMSGNLSLGMLMAFQSLMLSFLEPVARLVNLGSTLQELEGDLERLDDVLKSPVDPCFQVPTSEPLIGNAPTSEPGTVKLRGQIDLKALTFGYSPVSPALIEDLSLSVTPGQRIGIVGGSGSGKSTIARLIAGLYQPWSGSIWLDGQPLATIPRSVLTHSIAMVEQDLLLFEGSVRQNLTLWDSTVSDRDLIRACKDAEIHEVILSLPGGYDASLVEGGLNLSGGQRQRLELARALVNNPSILLLDEATSSLDAETERRIMRNLRRRSCTCIIVAHRLSTIRDCDQILVLDQGQVVQQGGHEQLATVDGFYRRLLQGSI